MIEQSLICKLLEAPDLEMFHSNGLLAEMFLTCKDEVQFILDHYHKYKQMPDKVTFLGHFKEFQMLEVQESTDYLIYKLKEAYTYTKIVPIIQKSSDLVREDSIKAIEYIKAELENLTKEVPVNGNKDGYDIVTNARDRLQAYKERCEVKGLIGIPTGIDKLDELTNGWMWGEELVVVTGRTNVEGSYKDGLNKVRAGYEITLAGCELIAGRIIGEKSTAFKEKYLEAFGAPVEEKVEEPVSTDLTVEEVAKRLGCSERNVYRMIKAGKLEAIQKEILIPTTKTFVTEEALGVCMAERGMA